MMTVLHDNDYIAGIYRGWLVFSIGCIGGLLSMFYRVSMTVITPELSHDLALSPEQLGHLSSFFFYAFALSQIPIGVALDAFGPRLVLGILNAVAVIGALFFSKADTFHMALCGRIMMGVGMGCNFMGLLKLIASWFPAKMFATLGGVFLSVATLGNLLAATPLAYLSTNIGWRFCFLLIAMVNTLFIALLLVFIRNMPNSSGENKKENNLKAVSSGLLYLITFRSYWVISIASFFRYGAFVAIQALWAGPFLLYGLRIDKQTTANALFAMGIGYMISLPISGYLSDRFLKSRKMVVIPSLLIMALLILLLSNLSPHENLYIIISLFFMLGTAAAPGQIMFTHIKELSPDKLIGTAMTGVNLFTMLGAAFIIQFMGFLIGDVHASLLVIEDFKLGFYFCSIGLIVTSFFYTFIPDR